MNELESSIKKSFSEHVDGNVRPLPPGRLARVTIARGVVALTAAAAVIAAAAVGYSITTSRLQPETQPAAARGSDDSAFTDVQANTPVAAGSHAGARWELFADRREYGSGPALDSLLCMKIDFGGVPGDQGCNLAWNAPPTEGFVAPIWYRTARGPIVIYGAAQEAVASVDLFVDGHPAPSRVYEAPADLASTLDFFVGFIPPGTDVVQLVARDAAGNELESRTLGARPEP